MSAYSLPLSSVPVSMQDEDEDETRVTSKNVRLAAAAMMGMLLISGRDLQNSLQKLIS